MVRTTTIETDAKQAEATNVECSPHLAAIMEPSETEKKLVT